MKRLLLVTVPLLCTFYSYAQNTFPWSSTGNVGIGTTNTINNLLNIGSSSNRGTVEVVGSTTNAPTITLTDSRTGGHSYSIYSGLSALGNFELLDQMEQTNKYRMIISPSGNVGFGVSAAPYFKLQVESANPGVARFATSNTGNTGNISITNASNYNYGVIGVVSGSPNNPATDVYGLGYSSNANSSFTNVLSWTSGGKVGIGTVKPDELLSVAGTIHSQEVKVNMNGWSDYVFKPQYKLLPIADVKAYIDRNQHLPGVPSEEEVKKNGINLGEMNSKLLGKIEELTLYLIEKDNQVKSQQEQIDELKLQVNKLLSKSL